MYLFPQNLGAFVEELMNNTAEYYRARGIAYFRKASPNYFHLSKFSKKRDNSFCFGGGGEQKKESFQIRLGSKGDLDFYGVYKGRYFSLELKETRREIFSTSLLKKHQLEQLEEIENCGGISLLLIHFFLEESTFILFKYSELQNLMKYKKKKSFSLAELKTIQNYELKIIYPHIFDLSQALDQIIADLALLGDNT